MHFQRVALGVPVFIFFSLVTILKSVSASPIEIDAINDKELEEIVREAKKSHRYAMSGGTNSEDGSDSDSALGESRIISVRGDEPDFKKLLEEVYMFPIMFSLFQI